MDKATFLRTSPREIGCLLSAVSDRERRRFVPAALICATIHNIFCSSEDEPKTVKDFLPGAEAPKSKEEEMIEWLEHLDRVERGEEEEEYDEEEMEAFKRKLKQTFKMGQQRGPMQTASTVGPSGKPQAVNAIAGETPRRGVL